MSVDVGSDPAPCWKDWAKGSITPGRSPRLVGRIEKKGASLPRLVEMIETKGSIAPARTPRLVGRIETQEALLPRLVGRIETRGASLAREGVLEGLRQRGASLPRLVEMVETRGASRHTRSKPVLA